MDLNNFLSEVERHLYKVSFNLSDEKIKKFVRACSKENAKYLVEQGLKKIKIDYGKFKSLTGNSSET